MFQNIGGGRAKCRVCQPEIILKTPDGSTSALHRHALVKHKKEYERSKTVESTLQPTLQQFIQKKAVSATKKIALDKAVVEMICIDLEPISVVQKKGFAKVLQTSEPNYKLPSRQYITEKLLPDLYNKTMSEIKAALQISHAIALTTDLWTSCTTNSYMGLTGHFFNETTKELECKTLSCIEFDGRHTAAALKARLLEASNDFGVTDKTSAIVADGAANIKKALNDMNVPHFACFAHVLNLVVTHAVESTELLTELRAKVSKVVGLTKRSTTASEVLTKCQKTVGMTSILKLKQDVPTRWNSMYDMMARFHQLKSAINLFVAEYPSDSVSPFSPAEWKAIQALEEVLKPLLSVTKELSSEKYPSLSKVVPLTKSLMTFYRNQSQKVSST